MFLATEYQQRLKFLDNVDHGYLNGGIIERLLTPENDNNPHCKIDAVQWGARDLKQCIDSISHESIFLSGISHRDGTVSLARPPSGTGKVCVFICIGDQPCLDYGGAMKIG